MKNRKAGARPPEDAAFGPQLALALALMGCSLLLLVVVSLARNDDWDDAFMFIRYADHWIESRTMAWNLGEGPAYGLTSPAYLLVVIPLRFMLRGNAVLTGIVASALCSLVACLFFVMLVNKLSATPRAKVLVILTVIVALLLMPGRNDLVSHFVSGMDTMFAIAFVTVFLLAVKWQDSVGSLRVALCVGAIGGCAFLVRPDLLILTGSPPIGLFLLQSQRGARARAILWGLLTLLTAALLSVLAHRYLGSYLPLSFYAKTRHLYGAEFERVYSTTGLLQLSKYLFDIKYLILPVIFGVAFWRSGFTATEKGLLIGVLLYLMYFAGFVIQVMPYEARFFFPTVPIIAYAAAKAMVSPAEELLARVPTRRIATGAALIALIPLAISSLSAATLVLQSRQGLATRPLTDGQALETEQLLAFSVGLPDDFVIATTEVGYVGALNPHKTIIDLAGLNSLAFAHQPFSAAMLLELKRRPDILVCDDDYSAIWRQLQKSEEFGSNYELIQVDRLWIGIYRKSRYSAQMNAILDYAKQVLSTGRQRGPRFEGAEL
jgi:hypothetical protein